MLSEAEFLCDQAARAKARFWRTASTLGTELQAPFDVRPLIRRRPWWSVAGATVAGFVAGLALRRSRAKVGAERTAKSGQGTLAIVRRLRTVLGSALGAIVAASLRGAAPTPTAPSANGSHANGSAASGPREESAANAP